MFNKINFILRFWALSLDCCCSVTSQDGKVWTLKLLIKSNQFEWSVKEKQLSSVKGKELSKKHQGHCSSPLVPLPIRPLLNGRTWQTQLHKRSSFVAFLVSDKRDKTSQGLTILSTPPGRRSAFVCKDIITSDSAICQSHWGKNINWFTPHLLSQEQQ